METTITKHVGSITDKYWAKIILNKDGDVTQIQLYQYTGHPSRGDVKKSCWVMDGNKGRDLIRAIEKELPSLKD